MVEMGICEYIKSSLTNQRPHILVLTGYAGDGKTSLMFRTLKDRRIGTKELMCQWSAVKTGSDSDPPFEKELTGSIAGYPIHSARHSLHNYNAQNPNAFGEKNIKSPFYPKTMVEMGICESYRSGRLSGIS